MTTHNFAKTSNIITFKFGTVTESHTLYGEKVVNTYHAFDYAAGRGNFEVTDIIIVDADNSSQVNDELIEAALA